MCSDFSRIAFLRLFECWSKCASRAFHVLPNTLGFDDTFRSSEQRGLTRRPRWAVSGGSPSLIRRHVPSHTSTMTSRLRLFTGKLQAHKRFIIPFCACLNGPLGKRFSAALLLLADRQETSSYQRSRKRLQTTCIQIQGNLNPFLSRDG